VFWSSCYSLPWRSRYRCELSWWTCRAVFWSSCYSLPWRSRYRCELSWWTVELLLAEPLFAVLAEPLPTEPLSAEPLLAEPLLG
jgi:hypothetical protein